MPGPLVLSHITAYNQCASLAQVIIPLELTPEQSVYEASPGGSHILWLLGHIALATEGLVGRRVGLVSALPAEWEPLFVSGSVPLLDVAAYPPYATLRAAAIESLRNLAGQLSALDDSVLAQPMPAEFPLIQMAPHVDAFLSFGQLHANYHLGQITFLLRAQGLKAGVGM